MIQLTSLSTFMIQTKVNTNNHIQDVNICTPPIAKLLRGLWVLNEIIFKRYAESLKKNGGSRLGVAC